MITVVVSDGDGALARGRAAQEAVDLSIPSTPATLGLDRNLMCEVTVDGRT